MWANLWQNMKRHRSTERKWGSNEKKNRKFCSYLESQSSRTLNDEHHFPMHWSPVDGTATLGAQAKQIHSICIISIDAFIGTNTESERFKTTIWRCFFFIKRKKKKMLILFVHFLARTKSSAKRNETKRFEWTDE